MIELGDLVGLNAMFSSVCDTFPATRNEPTVSISVIVNLLIYIMNMTLNVMFTVVKVKIGLVKTCKFGCDIMNILPFYKRFLCCKNIIKICHNEPVIARVSRNVPPIFTKILEPLRDLLLG